MSAQTQTIVCPACNSADFFKDGTRKLSDNTEKQRFICKSCGYRYTLNTKNDNSVLNQISANRLVKNLATAQKPKKFCADDVTKLPLETQGILTQFYVYLDKNAYSASTLYPRVIKQLAKLGADLHDPENVKTVIAQMQYKDRKTGETKKVTNGTKAFYCSAYEALASMLKIKFENPGYRQEEKEVYVPYESELDALITAARSQRMATYLQCLKETYADPTEALRIEWIDVDFKTKTIKINHPVKNHNSGTMPVSIKLLQMIEALPHDKPRVFPCTYNNISVAFFRLRKRVAAIQHNPRILAVELRGFRHWGGTKIAYETNGNSCEVKRLLRHKSLSSTERYIGKIDFSNKQECDTTSATVLEDILRLGSTGWIEFSVVKINGIEHHCFKKPKAFTEKNQC